MHEAEPMNIIQVNMLVHFERLFIVDNAFNTHEAVEKKARQSVESILKFLEEGRFTTEIA